MGTVTAIEGTSGKEDIHALPPGKGADPAVVLLKSALATLLVQF